MPRKSKSGSAYPPDWPAISTRVKDDAGWRCVRCGREHTTRQGYGLTVHHLDLNPSHSEYDLYWWNLAALCCPCHLQIQHKVVLERPWAIVDHSAWFQPYAAGWYAYRYLGEHLSRAEVMARLGELLQLERRALGVA
jgi:hypothetical protein